ncbi:GNAT family N-acetyltransferase [Streptomyces sp. NPDC059506]|uniref:GNAT family N-acetyltransferase n=1 Tax=unclassified Streptomyces TaxID=2593676 RepID=UPI0022AB08FB|nr:GNAT family N-acetyltransferase [Streptomyces sp. HB2AG]MCZ2527394.1 GNAT family N-acetyltransferase [Streptomyces sp. HB2AG]
MREDRGTPRAPGTPDAPEAPDGPAAPAVPDGPASPASPAGAFTLRPVDPAADLGTVHAWMNDPEVARFWEMAHPPDRIGDYLREQIASAHSTPWIGCIDGEPMSYWELYRADLDPLARHYTARPRDAGVHLLLGPSRFRGRGLGARLLRIVSDRQLAADPYAQRVVAEPDVRNVRSVRAFERAGFRMAGQLELPDKRAAFMVRERAG